MEIIAMLGSPRTTGNTAALLDAAVKGASEAGAHVQTLNLTRLKIAPCLGCSRCFETGRCIQKDDMEMVYHLLKTMDGLILASPIYFYNVSAQTKAMIDRCQAIWAAKKLLANARPLAHENRIRRGLFVATAGRPQYKTALAATRAVVKIFFRTIDVEYSGEVLAPDTDRVPASNNAAALKAAYEAGLRLARSLFSPPIQNGLSPHSNSMRIISNRGCNHELETNPQDDHDPPGLAASGVGAFRPSPHQH